MIRGSYEIVGFGKIISRIAHSTYYTRMLGFMPVRNVLSVNTAALSCRKPSSAGTFRTTQARGSRTFRTTQARGSRAFRTTQARGSRTSAVNF
jgi:hypothetical protein